MSPHSEMRSKILDVAQRLIQQRGINGMSYKDISEEVQIRKASIHHHFPSKEDLLVALLTRYRKDFQQLVDEIVGSKVQTKTKLRKFMKLFHETINRGKNDSACLCGMLASEILCIGEESVRLVNAFLSDCHGWIKTIIQQGIDDGSFSVEGKLDDCADLFLVALEGGLILSRSSGGPRRFAAITRQLEQTITPS